MIKLAIIPERGFIVYDNTMISRSFRIATKEFPGVTRGKLVTNDFFRVSIKKDNTLPHTKCAVIISQKIAKTAVSRNKIRRQVYAWIREHITKLPIAYVCFYPKSAPMSYEALDKSLKELLWERK